MKEIWADIKGYEGLYQVSNLGRVKSLGNKSNHKSEKIMAQAMVSNYMQVALCKNSKSKIFKVHRLVANAFIPNHQNKPQVNHKDGNKLNNRAGNLEWVTAKENAIHAHRTGLAKAQKGAENSRSIKVEQIDLITGKVINTFSCLREVERELGYYKDTISKCCKGIFKQGYGYKWRFADERMAN